MPLRFLFLHLFQTFLPDFLAKTWFLSQECYKSLYSLKITKIKTLEKIAIEYYCPQNTQNVIVLTILADFVLLFFELKCMGKVKLKTHRFTVPTTSQTISPLCFKEGCVLTASKKEHGKTELVTSCWPSWHREGFLVGSITCQ